MQSKLQTRFMILLKALVIVPFFVETFQRFKAPFFRRFKTLSKVIEHVFFFCTVCPVLDFQIHTHTSTRRVYELENYAISRSYAIYWY